MNSKVRGSIFRIVRVMVVVLLLITLSMWVRDYLSSLASEQAVINAQVLQIRTPIGGQLEFADIRPGTFVKKGEVLLKVVNSRFGDRVSAAQANSLELHVEELQNEAVSARYTRDVDRVTRDQYRRLHASGAISRMEVMKAESRYDMAVELATSKEEQLIQARRRSEEMAQQSMLQKESVITMPTDGVIWAVAGKPGEQVEPNHLVMEIINPANIWVDAFFAERHAGELRPGQPVTIHSLDGTESWKGVLESVRAGVGRMIVDNSVAVPPPETVKRQIAVRVTTAWTGSFDPVAFCGVGRSVEVSFPRDAKPGTFAGLLQTKWKQTWGESRANTTAANH